MISNNDTNLNLSFHPPNPCLLPLPRSLMLSSFPTVVGQKNVNFAHTWCPNSGGHILKFPQLFGHYVCPKWNCLSTLTFHSHPRPLKNKQNKTHINKNIFLNKNQFKKSAHKPIQSYTSKSPCQWLKITYAKSITSGDQFSFAYITHHKSQYRILENCRSHPHCQYNLSSY